MGQKSNPVALRLQTTNRHFDNGWYSSNFYTKLLSKDIWLQQHINTFLKLLKLPRGRFSIQYLPKKILLYTFFCYPKYSRESRSKFFGMVQKSPFSKKKFSFFKRKKIVPSNKQKLLFFSGWSQIHGVDFFKMQGVIRSIQDEKLWFKCFQKLSKNNLVFLKKYNFFQTKTTTRIWSKKSNFFQKIPFGPKNTVFWKETTKITNVSKSKEKTHLDKQLNLFFNLVSFYQQYKQIPQIKPLWSRSKIGSLKNDIGCFQKRNLDSKTGFLNKPTLFFGTKEKQALFLKLKKTKNQQNNLRYIIALNVISQISSRNIPKLKYLMMKNRLFASLFHFKFFGGLLEKTTLGPLKNTSGSFQKTLFFEPTKFLKNPTEKSTPLVVQSKSYSNVIDLSFKNLQNLQFYDSKINRFHDGLDLNFLSRNQSNFQKYKKGLENYFSSGSNLHVEWVPFKIENDWQSALYLADEIVYFLEKRVPFRRIKSRILKQVSQISSIQGVRISCSGRVGGKSKKAQRAKTECIKYGQTSLQVFSNRIDFAANTAQTSFGCVGVKVWICYKAIT